MNLFYLNMLGMEHFVWIIERSRNRICNFVDNKIINGIFGEEINSSTRIFGK